MIAGWIGRRGERVAARWLRRHGFVILGRNVYVGADEADVLAIAPDGVTVVVVEVKTRAGKGPAPVHDVDIFKRRRLIRLAQRLSQEPDLADRPFRFDVITVDWREGRRAVRHWEAAFEQE